MPPLLRSILAVLAGYIAMAVVVMLCTPLAVKLFAVHSGRPTPPYLATNIAYSFLAALLAGYVAARLAPARPLLHAV